MLRVPRDLLERMAAMRSESADGQHGRLVTWAIRLLALWFAIDVYMFAMREFIRPAWKYLRWWWYWAP